MQTLLSFLESLGRGTREFLTETWRLSRLTADAAYWTFGAPLAGRRGLRREAFVKQMVFTGNESLFITALVTAAVGAVLALQSAYQLRQFGALLYTGALVNVSMTRELGPVVAAIVIAGRVGASITAELGTMKVQEEVDALTTMGIPAVPYLVLPRLFALMVMLPCLTILGDAIGILGGLFIGTVVLDIQPMLYLQTSFEALVPKDVITGVVKSVVFAFLIAVTATYQGLSVRGGAEGVGRATTQSVVLSIIAIILADCFCTTIFFYVFP